MIKFEHTIFALPFALISTILAAQQSQSHSIFPAGRTVGWVLVAMVGARSAAMAFNRLIDADYDLKNPRTAQRALPLGLVSPIHCAIFVCISAALLIVASWELNRICFLLSPIALIAILGYSLTKRFTAWCHIVLGASIGLAPVGAWIAVSGSLSVVPILLAAAVMLWIGGFDIIYALQDREFDQKAGLYSLPVRLGPARALMISRIMHTLMLFALLGVGMVARLTPIYFIGVLAVTLLIAYEQSLVAPNDLGRVNLAFFTMNGWVSISLFFAVLIDRWSVR